VRAAAIDAEEKADEDFVKSIFSKNGDVKVSLGLVLDRYADPDPRSFCLLGKFFNVDSGSYL